MSEAESSSLSSSGRTRPPERFDHLYIGGAWEVSHGAPDNLLESVCPADGRVWATLPAADAADAERAVAAAAAAVAAPDWRGSTPAQRARLLTGLAAAIRANAERLAWIETMDCGKPIRETRDQVGAAASWCDYFAAIASTSEGRFLELSPGTSAYVTVAPVGVVVGILPANSPLLLSVWKLAPCLAVGNAVILKPSEDAGASVLEMGRLLNGLDLPPGVVSVLTGPPEPVSDVFLSHPDVAHVSFTGSTPVGRRIGAQAVAAGKRVTLELGGSNSLVIFADANLEHAVRAATEGAFVAAGQTCARATRILVEEPAYDFVVRELAQRAGRIRVGDPLVERTQMGPLRSDRSRADVRQAVGVALGRGAELVAGGVDLVPDGALRDGFFYAPTVLSAPGAAAGDNEIFGPVATVVPFRTEADAVAAVNASAYGLVCGIWTADGSRAWRVARQVEAGLTWVNTYRRVHWRVPYGGLKASGFGRENGAEAIREYGATKAVMVDFSGVFADAFGDDGAEFNPHFGH
jgi:(Z)-2-((N-methylformamido)methylene)-5-hydroxybutyrolactone dehydrogenase